MTPSPPPYPPPMYPYGAPPAPPADPAKVPRLLAGLLAVLAAGLIVVGTFLPTTTFVQLNDGKRGDSIATSSWSRTFDPEPDAETKKFYENTHVSRYGIPLTAGALVLLVGAGLAFAGRKRAGRTVLVIGAAGVAGAVWMLGMDVSATLSFDQTTGQFQSDYGTGLGFWLLLGGGVVAVAVLGLALLAGREPAMPRQFAAYQPTVQPGYGGPPSQQFPGQPPVSQPFPAQPPVSHPFPAQPPISQPFPAQPPVSQPFPAQPYTGQPPMSQPFAAQPPARDLPPTEPNYQLPPLDPPKT